MVTFSAHNKFYSKHSNNFNLTVQSLKVVASAELAKLPDRPSTDVFGGPDGQGGVDQGIERDPASNPERSSGVFRKLALGLLLLVGTLTLFIFFRRLQKK